MRDFKIALVQQCSPVLKKKQNLEHAVQWRRKAGKAGATLVCFPELNITGHAGHAAMVKQAEPVPDGPSVARLCEVARELGLYVCAGIAEDDLGIHYNTQFIVGSDDYLGKQRKAHLSADEYFYCRHGTELPVLNLPFARVGMIICYDNALPEISRCLAVNGAEVILCPHAARFGKWPKTPADRRKVTRRIKEQWRMVHRCRAYDNGCYAAVFNAAGRSAVGLRGVEANHGGCCMVFDPNGEVAAESRTTDIREEMLIADLEGERVSARRRQTCFNLQTRRPEVFRTLIQPTQ